MSPRRSSRARTTQPPAAPTHTNSSTSSVSSGRPERSTRSNNKQVSPHNSNPRSQSLDDLDDTKPPPRRTRSGHEDVKESKKGEDEEEEEEGEEEEVTRCICGQTEYPGLPSPTQDLLKQKAREPDAIYALDAIGEDLGGLFIQCDVCKVWQHGGCVSILDEASVPDEYFCEECRRDLHRVATSLSGQRYSNYLPLKEGSSPLASPQPPSRERSKRNADNKNRPAQEAPKRRSTMNSREIYDEAEELRRAIEESKKDGLPGTAEGLRKKRSREDSEDQKSSTKRQRTGSQSISPADEKDQDISSSDEALASKAGAEHTPKKSIRGAAARNHQAKELRDQKERERQEAASRRKSRVERRRGEESDNIEDIQPPPPSTVSTPPAADTPVPRSSHRKNGRTAVKGTRRVGRNQYTKDRDLPTSSLSQTLDPNARDIRGSRARSRSRSNARDLESPNGGSSINGTAGTTSLLGSALGEFGSRPSRPRHLNPNRTSMNEMKKRVAAILEFVNRAEDEDPKRVPSAGSDASTATASSSTVPDEYKSVAAKTESELEFATLDARDMLRTLKARLVSWEDEYGRYSR